MFARARGTLRRALRALSACLWLRPGGAPALGTPFSYAAPGQPNELVLLAWGGRPMELLVDDQAVPLALSPSPGRWQHVCVTWAAAGGTWRSFQDGVPRGRGGGLAAGHPLRPRGVLVLGQEQDALGGRFDATQAFVGEISDFHLWGRVLDAAEVAAVAGCSTRPAGDLLAWTEGGLELHGGVTTLPFDPCP
ncbi:neuronal pentraxin-2-like [Calonectris borealis]|uniref:neuronal pentraxin-2-like n=1 Tax=Calonectris borealis TaxID=1323832 RepID=UPI003F4C27C0